MACEIDVKICCDVVEKCNLESAVVLGVLKNMNVSGTSNHDGYIDFKVEDIEIELPFFAPKHQYMKIPRALALLQEVGIIELTNSNEGHTVWSALCSDKPVAFKIVEGYGD